MSKKIQELENKVRELGYAQERYERRFIAQKNAIRQLANFLGVRDQDDHRCGLKPRVPVEENPLLGKEPTSRMAREVSVQGETILALLAEMGLTIAEIPEQTIPATVRLVKASKAGKKEA